LKNFNDISHFYFIGIGGIGMSALARYVKSLGKTVSGYDKTKTQLTRALSDEGISITYIDAISEIDTLIYSLDKTWVIYTPAIPKENVIFNYFKSFNYHVIKRSALLGEVTENSFCLAVAGTHGKTTTSAILGHLLAASDMPVTAFLGGIAENYQSNFISKGTEITVVEADEFDRSFLTLSPDVACITSMDADHLDIYGEASVLEESFQEFASLLSNSENLIFQKGLPLSGKSVSVDEIADYHATNTRIENGSYVFDLQTPNALYKELVFHLPGHHNLSNAITAFGMALHTEANPEKLTKALANFTGVDRRFSYKIKAEDIVLIDDYAHHPKELDALFQAVTEMYPIERKVIVFQPHLFSRTQDFEAAFAQSLEKFDEVLLLDIYPARELPIEGVNSANLLEKIKNPNKALITKNMIPEKLKESNCKIKLMVGAGDIGAEVQTVTKYLQNED